MNLFDEHLFDEEMKLFKFPNENEQKETKETKANDEKQNNIFTDKELNIRNESNDNLNDKQNKSENSHKPHKKTRKQYSKEHKNKNQSVDMPLNRFNFQYNSQPKLMGQQSSIPTQCLQPNCSFHNNVIPPSMGVKNMNVMSYNPQNMPNMSLFQQQGYLNQNFVNLNKNLQLMPNVANNENLHQDMSSIIQAKTNSSLEAQNFNIDSSNSMNNIMPNNNMFFHQNANPDVNLANPGGNIDVNLKNILLYNDSNKDEDLIFKDALENVNMRFNPAKLGFIPSAFWSDNDMTFNDIVKSFFQRKNNSKCRFPHKLYNALIFTQNDPSLFPLIGVYWVDRTSILIRRKTFARLLGIKSIEGSLFHQQGNFPSHGFAEVDPQVVKMKFPNFDFSVNRLITHTAGVFVYGCKESDINECRWNSSNK